MPVWLLYSAVVLIWGSTFFGIKFQLGSVDPLVSVVYRFALAVLMLFGWCWWKKLPVKLSAGHHPYLLAQGACLFGFNYWLVYLAEEHVTSGIVAVIFTTIIFFNIFNGRLFLKRSVSQLVVWGSLLGAVGIGFIYYPEIQGVNRNNTPVYGLALSLGAPLVASLGNIAATRNGQYKLPVIQTNAWSMTYGTLLMLVLALVLDKPFTMEWTFPYLSSMIYLAFFGTVIAFGCYLLLLQRIGPERAAYSSLLFPVVALGLSTLFEGYQWTLSALAGFGLILAGNHLVLRK